MESRTDSKNKRKFRVWDNITLFQALEQTNQLITKIEELCGDDTGPKDLPMSMIPTDILYNIAVCYEAMYDKLLDEDLLVAGYPKSNSTKTH
jgi:hypothetical protein